MAKNGVTAVVSKLKKLDIVLFLVLVAIGIVGTSVPLFDMDEGAFLEASREMLETKQWSVTTLDGQARYDKPILAYWFQSFFLWAFSPFYGVISIETIGRLPSIIAGSLWVLVLAKFTLEQTQCTNRALFVGAVCLTSLGTSIIHRAATADALLNLFLVLILCDLIRYQLNPTYKLRLRLFFWASLGLITKGPVAIIIPFGASFLFSLNNFSWQWFKEIILCKTGWLILCIITIPWLISVWNIQGSSFLSQFLLHHNFERFTGNLHGHGGFIGYVFLILPLIMLPFTGLIIAIFCNLGRLWKSKLDQFCLLWCFWALLLVSLSGTQLPHYILYSTPGLFLLFGRVLPTIKSKWWALPGIFFPLFMMILWLIPEKVFKLFEPNSTSEHLEMTITILNYKKQAFLTLIPVILVCLYSLFSKQLKLDKRLLYQGAAQFILVTTLLIPAISNFRQLPVKEAALIAKGANAKVVSVGIRKPSFSFYRQSITEQRLPRPDSKEWVLVSSEESSNLIEEFGPFKERVSNSRWLLLEPRND